MFIKHSSNKLLKACELIVLSSEQVERIPFRCTSLEEEIKTFES
jgi:hypothetical protein